MFAIVKCQVVALAMQTVLAGGVEFDPADRFEARGGVRASWEGRAEIHLALDDEGKISFDSPCQLHLDGKVRIETEDLQLEADRLSFETTSGRLILESRAPDGARLSVRARGGGFALRVVGRRLLFRFPEKSLQVEGLGSVQMLRRR
jgi:hypothetical protein